MPSFIPTLPKDPWGNPYAYFQPGQHGNGTYDIISYGADGKEGGTGNDADITNYDTEMKDINKK